jgi:hypothetical protein
MKIHVYSVMRNEEKMLPFFLRHYCEYAEKIFIYDDRSDDKTREIASECESVVLRETEYTGFDDAKQSNLYSTEYRKDRTADWIMCVDCDEFVYHKYLFTALDQALMQQRPILAPHGYEMVHESFPVGYGGQLYDVVRNGFHEPWYSKPCVFRSNIDINYTAGRHESTNGPAWQTDGLKLLHFRYFGQCYNVSRNAKNASRLTKENIERSYGTHVLPDAQGSHTPSWYEQKKVEAKPCLD